MHVVIKYFARPSPFDFFVVADRLTDMSAAAAATTLPSPSQQSDGWHERTQIGSSSTHTHSGLYGYVSYEGYLTAYRFGCMLEPEDIGQIAFDTFMQTYVENLTTGDNKTDVVGVAFNKAIAEREAALSVDHKISSEQYQKLPYSVRYRAHYYVLKGTGKDNLKLKAAEIRKNAEVAGIKKSKLAATFLREPIAAYIGYFESKATSEKPIPLSSENLNDWIRIECLTGRTHVIIGLAPIENVVSFINGSITSNEGTERPRKRAKTGAKPKAKSNVKRTSSVSAASSCDAASQ